MKPSKHPFAIMRVSPKRDGKVTARAEAVANAGLYQVRKRLNKILGAAGFFEGAPFNCVHMIVNMYEDKNSAYRYSHSIGRSPRWLEVGIAGNATTIAHMPVNAFTKVLQWTIFDVLIDIGGKRGYNVNGLAKERAKLSAPRPARNPFPGVLTDNREPPDPEPEDPFKHELEIVVPLPEDLSSRDVLRHAHELEDDFDYELRSHLVIGMVETREMGAGEATYFLVATEKVRLVEGARRAIRRNEWVKRASGWIRGVDSDAKGQRVKL